MQKTTKICREFKALECREEGLSANQSDGENAIISYVSRRFIQKYQKNSKTTQRRNWPTLAKIIEKMNEKTQAD